MLPSLPSSLRAASILVLLGSLGHAIPAQSRFLRLDGPDRWHIYGRNAAQLDDLDGDGIRDVLVGLRSGGQLYVHSGEDGSLLYSVSGGPNLHDLGWSILSPGDLDGDGLGDIVAGGPVAPVNGIIAMISTKTKKISRYVLGVWGSRLGWSLATLPDIDNDGVPEIVAGAPRELSKSRGTVGAVHVFSGKTFKILRSFYPGKTTNASFGNSVAVGGDLDADGFPDLAIGYPNDNGNYGSCSIYSGKSGKLIRKISGPTNARTSFGSQVAWIGDQDSDKISDLLIGALPGSSQTTGSVHIVSGKTGKTIWTITGKQGLGESLSSAGDVDGDGVEDILVGAPAEPSVGKLHYGVALLYSGKTRKVIFSINSAPSLTSVGFSVGGNWDLDRDGKPEFWLGAYTGSSSDSGTLRFYTARHLSLEADLRLLSVSHGGTQDLKLDAGAQNASKLYVTLGSISGTKPGIRIGSLLLPLNPDVYQDFTLTAPNNPPLLGGVSFLDQNGRGAVQFRIPAGTPAKFKALKFHHAFLVLDILKGRVTFASNAVSARLID